MKSKAHFKKFMSALLIFAMLGGVLYGLNADAFNPGTIWARVDESIGLRADAYIGTARGITGSDTRIYTHRHNGNGIANIPTGANPVLPISITPNKHYALTGVTVVAFATIEHQNGMNNGWGTRQVVTDIRTWENLTYTDNTAPWTNNYTVPTDYFRTFYHNKVASRMEIEVVLYADFTYRDTSTPVYDIELGEGFLRISVNGGAATNHTWNGNTLPAGLHWTAFNGSATTTWTSPMSRTPPSGSVGRGLFIDASNASINGSTIRITGTSAANTSRGAWHILVEGDRTATRQSVHLILDNVTIFPGIGADSGNFWNHRQASSDAYTTMIQHFSSFNGNTTRIADTLMSNTFGTALSGAPNGGDITSGSGNGGNFANRSPLIFTNVDAFVTLRGSNTLAHSDIRWTHPSTTAIHVDASASLVFTDTSNGSLYARGAGCSSAIGTMHLPVGYIQIDGGHITAESATSSHQFAGIGHGGHSEHMAWPNQVVVGDPNLRGIVINGGRVDAFGFHYGIGANGGGKNDSTNATSLNADIGPTYIVITGGVVAAEASAGSGGAAIGFAYNNNIHQVRIGRMDKDNTDTSVTSVNWGNGAAISGNMTFYSGSTTAYSGQYAAAIGGNAVSDARTTATQISAAQSAATAMPGAPLTVYGGEVTVRAGAFSQTNLPGGFQDDVNLARGGSPGTRPLYPSGFASRVGVQAAFTAAYDPNVTGYGAGIGGAIRRDGGSRNLIFGGFFDVTSSSHGAGIGGGGSNGTTNAGRGTGTNPGDGTWLGTNYIRWNVPHTDLTDKGMLAPMFFDIVSGTYGAGIGGGGTDIAGIRGGDGGNIFIGGGNFNVHSGEFGAGIGGGGSLNGPGGNGGDVVIAE